MATSSVSARRVAAGAYARQPSFPDRLLGGRPEIVVALDWTDLDQDNQSMIALHLVTKHGRATPLLRKSVVRSELKDWRNEHEDVLQSSDA